MIGNTGGLSTPNAKTKVTHSAVDREVPKAARKAFEALGLTQPTEVNRNLHMG